MIRYHHQFNGNEFEQTPGDSESQGSLVCCSSWSCKESDTTQQQQQQIAFLGKGGHSKQMPSKLCIPTLRA